MTTISRTSNSRYVHHDSTHIKPKHASLTCTCIDVSKHARFHSLKNTTFVLPFFFSTKSCYFSYLPDNWANTIELGPRALYTCASSHCNPGCRPSVLDLATGVCLLVQHDLVKPKGEGSSHCHQQGVLLHNNQPIMLYKSVLSWCQR